MGAVATHTAVSAIVRAAVCEVWQYFTSMWTCQQVARGTAALSASRPTFHSSKIITLKCG